MKSTRIFIEFIFLLTFTFCISAQSDSISPKPIPSFKTSQNEIIELGTVSPNELDGYKFFSEGKLKNLKLGFSIREDVKNIFGEPRQVIANIEVYDYDSNWEIRFHYFDDSDKYQGPYRRGKPSLILSPEYIGKLCAIRLFPKKTVSFSETNFPTAFRKGTTSRGMEYSYHYLDSYGLVYEIFERSSIKNELRRQDDLMDINYVILYNLFEQILVEPE